MNKKNLSKEEQIAYEVELQEIRRQEQEAHWDRQNEINKISREQEHDDRQVIEDAKMFSGIRN